MPKPKQIQSSKWVLAGVPAYNGAGIYAITDPEGRAYVGSSKFIRDRILSHCYQLAHGSDSKKLQAAYDSGIRFHVSVLKKLAGDISKVELITAERKCAEMLGAYYNNSEIITPRTSSRVYSESELEKLPPLDDDSKDKKE